MKAKSAQRNTLRKVTRKASEIRKIVSKKGGYFSVFREGGSEKYTDYLKLGRSTARMFEDACEKKVSKSEIILKLRAAYLDRQQNGLEGAFPEVEQLRVTVPRDCPTRFSVPMYKNKSEVIRMMKQTNEKATMLNFYEL